MRWTRPAVLLIGPLLLSACANTQLMSTWRDPEVAGVTFRKVLAVAMTINPARRRAVEDRMVTDIERAGAQAVPSYSMITAGETRNVDAVKAAVLAGGFDGAVTWRSISVREVTSFVPGPSIGFWGYYDAGWAAAYDPGYLRTDQVVRVQTKVYRVTAAGNDRLIWSGTSRTVDPGSLDALVDGVTDATIDSMRSNGMLAARR